MTDERLDATAAALRGAADAVRGVREARAQLGAEVADATQRAQLAEDELQATRDRARALIAAAQEGADRADAVCLNIQATARNIVGATRTLPPGVPAAAVELAELREEADIIAAARAAGEAIVARAVRQGADVEGEVDDLGVEAEELERRLVFVQHRYRAGRMALVRHRRPTSDDAAGCAVSPDDPQTRHIREGDDMGG